MGTVSLIAVENKKTMKDFIDLPWSIYKNDPNWVAPLKLAIKDILSPKHPFYQTSVIRYWVAYRDQRPVGRIAAINNRAYNEYHECKAGFFGFFEAIDDQDITHQLVERAKTWLLNEGLEELIGPCNPSTNYEAGLLVDGHDDPPQVMMTYNPPYYSTLLEKEGLKKAKDLFAHTIPTDSPITPTMTRLNERLKKRHNVTFRNLEKKHWQREVDIMLDIYNDAWEKNWGFVPMTKEEFNHTANDLKLIAQEELAILAFIDGKAAGFVVGLPDINQALIHNPSGKLLPFGIFKLLNFKKYTNRMRIPTLGVKQKYQKTGLASLLLTEIRNSAKETCFKTTEASWILEDNVNMNKPLFAFGSKIYKTYRIYSCALK